MHTEVVTGMNHILKKLRKEQERKMQGYFSELEEGNILIIVSEG
jgi:hypothetical protein